MSRLTRDGTAEPVSRDQILRHARGQGNIIFPVQLTTSRIGNLTRLVNTLLYLMTIHTCVFFLCAVVKWTQFADFREKNSYSIGLEHHQYISSGPSILPFSAISKHYDKTYCLWQLEDFSGVSHSR